MQVIADLRSEKKTCKFRVKFDAKSTKNASGGTPKHPKASMEQANPIVFDLLAFPGLTTIMILIILGFKSLLSRDPKND